MKRFCLELLLSEELVVFELLLDDCCLLSIPPGRKSTSMCTMYMFELILCFYGSTESTWLMRLIFHDINVCVCATLHANCKCVGKAALCQQHGST